MPTPAVAWAHRGTEQVIRRVKRRSRILGGLQDLAGDADRLGAGWNEIRSRLWLAKKGPFPRQFSRLAKGAFHELFRVSFTVSSQMKMLPNGNGSAK